MKWNSQSFFHLTYHLTLCNHIALGDSRCAWGTNMLAKNKLQLVRVQASSLCLALGLRLEVQADERHLLEMSATISYLLDKLVNLTLETPALQV